MSALTVALYAAAAYVGVVVGSILATIAVLVAIACLSGFLGWLANR